MVDRGSRKVARPAEQEHAGGYSPYHGARPTSSSGSKDTSRRAPPLNETLLGPSPSGLRRTRRRPSRVLFTPSTTDTGSDVADAASSVPADRMRYRHQIWAKRASPSNLFSTPYIAQMHRRLERRFALKPEPKFARRSTPPIAFLCASHLRWKRPGRRTN